MKRIAILTVLSALLFTPKVLGLVDIGGIVETGNVQLDVDSVRWHLLSSMIPIVDSTPGWGGPAGTTDTFQFEAKTEWPYRVEVFYQVDGVPRQLNIFPLLADTWYDLPTFHLQAPRVRFEDTLLVGISTPRLTSNPPLLTIAPNPVTYGKVWIYGPELGSELDLSVYDITGNEVHHSSLVISSARGVEVNISRLLTGVYLLKVMGNGGCLKQRLVLIQ